MQKWKCLNLEGGGGGGWSLIWLFQDWNLKKKLAYLKSASLNLSCCKLWWKNKNLSICNKFCLICGFFSWNLKSICYISNQPPQILLNAKFHEKLKLPKLKTKIALFGYFWPKMSYLALFGLEFEKNIVIYETSLLNLFCSKVFCKNKNP